MEEIKIYKSQEKNAPKNNNKKTAGKALYHKDLKAQLLSLSFLPCHLSHYHPHCSRIYRNL